MFALHKGFETEINPVIRPLDLPVRAEILGEAAAPDVPVAVGWMHYAAPWSAHHSLGAISRDRSENASLEFLEESRQEPEPASRLAVALSRGNHWEARYRGPGPALSQFIT